VEYDFYSSWILIDYKAIHCTRNSISSILIACITSYTNWVYGISSPIAWRSRILSLVTATISLQSLLEGRDPEAHLWSEDPSVFISPTMASHVYGYCCLFYSVNVFTYFSSLMLSIYVFICIACLWYFATSSFIKLNYRCSNRRGQILESVHWTSRDPLSANHIADSGPRDVFDPYFANVNWFISINVCWGSGSTS